MDNFSSNEAKKYSFIAKVVEKSIEQNPFACFKEQNNKDDNLFST